MEVLNLCWRKKNQYSCSSGDSIQSATLQRKWDVKFLDGDYLLLQRSLKLALVITF